jgi:hypothetical protein
MELMAEVSELVKSGEEECQSLRTENRKLNGQLDKINRFASAIKKS